MTAAEVARLRRRLNAWYRTHRRPLPWRDTRDPYRIWVSEVMLQQTQVRTALPYYRRFLRRFPSLKCLAGADEQAVLKCWEGLGYYARARNLHRAAARVVAAGGRVPDRWAGFRELPGVGDYIAAAVLSIAFDRPHAVVDGNVKRVLARLLALDAAADSPAGTRAFQAQADRLLDRARPGDFNQALMELGALVCTPRTPACGSCPLQGLCRAWCAGAVDRFPRRAPVRRVPEIDAAVGVVVRNNRVLVTRRPAGGLLGGLWEFPGGKIGPGETPAQACIREIAEEVGLRVSVTEPLAEVRHAYTHFRVRLHVLICRHLGGRVRLNGPTAFRWVRLAELDELALPKANHKFLPLLKRHMADRGRKRARSAA
jgi:A/G-specific adenine glycosylase